MYCLPDVSLNKKHTNTTESETVMNLNISDAHRLVRQQRARGNDVFWEGWEIVFFNPAPKAMYSTKGIFRDGRWGYANRFPVTDDGTWRVDGRNVR